MEFFDSPVSWVLVGWALCVLVVAIVGGWAINHAPLREEEED